MWICGYSNFTERIFQLNKWHNNLVKHATIQLFEFSPQESCKSESFFLRPIPMENFGAEGIIILQVNWV